MHPLNREHKHPLRRKERVRHHDVLRSDAVRVMREKMVITAAIRAVHDAVVVATIVLAKSMNRRSSVFAA